jgi:hypothetical protein
VWLCESFSLFSFLFQFLWIFGSILFVWWEGEGRKKEGRYFRERGLWITNLMGFD